MRRIMTTGVRDDSAARGPCCSSAALIPMEGKRRISESLSAISRAEPRPHLSDLARGLPCRIGISIEVSAACRKASRWRAGQAGHTTGEAPSQVRLRYRPIARLHAPAS
jgi:hypothetical protein